MDRMDTMERKWGVFMRKTEKNKTNMQVNNSTKGKRDQTREREVERETERKRRENERRDMCAAGKVRIFDYKVAAAAAVAAAGRQWSVPELSRQKGFVPVPVLYEFLSASRSVGSVPGPVCAWARSVIYSVRPVSLPASQPVSQPTQGRARAVEVEDGIMLLEALKEKKKTLCVICHREEQTRQAQTARDRGRLTSPQVFIPFMTLVLLILSSLHLFLPFLLPFAIPQQQQLFSFTLIHSLF